MENNNIVKKKFIRKPKKEQYVNERNNIHIFFNNLLNINDNNNKVDVVDIDNDDIKKQIKQKKELIFKIFKASHWGYYVANKNNIGNDDEKSVNNELSVIRPLYKELGYEITSKNITKTDNNGKKIKSIQWHFNKKL